MCISSGSLTTAILLLICASCGRTSLDAGGAVFSTRDAAADERGALKDSAADRAARSSDGADAFRADLAVDRPGDSVRSDTADAGPFGQFSRDAGSVANNVGINAVHDNAQPNDEVRSPLTKRWTAHFTGYVTQSLVANGRVFVSAVESPPNVRALDLESGATLWGPVVASSEVHIACDAVNVYTLDRDGRLSALDVKDGHVHWSTVIPVQYGFSSPVVAAGIIVVNAEGSGGSTCAFDAATGKSLWIATTIDGTEGSVAIDGNTVYEAEGCNQVSAFDLLSGSRRWYHYGGCTGGRGGTPVVSAGRIWAAEWMGGNIVLDLGGKDVGTFSADRPPSFHNGLVFYLTSQKLTAVDIETHASRWSFSTDRTFCTPATIAGRGGQVFVGLSTGELYEINEATGIQRSSDVAGTSISCSSDTRGFALAQNRLVVPAGHDLVAY